jgi:GNAT superfamily N-acetyltransferase
MPPESSVDPVRRATEADIPELVRVINLAYRVEEFFIAGDRVDVGEVASRLDCERGAFLVIGGDSPDSLAGAVYLEIIGVRGFFALLAVDPAQQGRGLARRLVGAVERECRDAGARTLDLEVVDLRTELPPFYQGLGFTVSGGGEFPNPAKLLRPARMIRMSKVLTGSDHPG